MKLQTILTILIGCLITISLIVILVYLCNFSSIPVSVDSSKWGAFGDYFGGILNPILGMINIVILVFISFSISEIEDKRFENEKTVQKNIALYSMKHDVLKTIDHSLNQIHLEIIESTEKSNLKIVMLGNKLINDFMIYEYLFPFFKEYNNKLLREKINVLGKIANDRFENSKDFDIETQLKPYLLEFFNLKEELIIEIQKYILE